MSLSIPLIFVGGATGILGFALRRKLKVAIVLWAVSGVFFAFGASLFSGATTAVAEAEFVEVYTHQMVLDALITDSDVVATGDDTTRNFDPKVKRARVVGMSMSSYADLLILAGYVVDVDVTGRAPIYGCYDLILIRPGLNGERMSLLHPEQLLACKTVVVFMTGPQTYKTLYEWAIRHLPGPTQVQFWDEALALNLDKLLMLIRNALIAMGG